MTPDTTHTVTNELGETASHWQLQTVLTIAGPSGVGKTTVSHALAKLYNTDAVKIGTQFRQSVARRGQHVFDHVQRTMEDDQATDAKVKYIIQESIATNTPAIVEARLSGWIARKIEESNQEAQGKVFTILLTTHDPEIRFQRLQRREKRKDGQRDLDLDTARASTLNRESLDWKSWTASDPELRFLDPSCPENPYTIYDARNPNDIYKLVIATDTMSVKEVTKAIHEALLAKGLVKAVS